MVTGYIVSTENQSFASMQMRSGISELASRNGEMIDRWIASGPSADSSVDAKALIDSMSGGDALYVNDVTSLGANFKEMISALAAAVKRGIRIYGVKDGYTNIGVKHSETYLQALEHMTSAYRLLVSSKTKAALGRKKNAGEKLGRPDGSCVRMRILIRNNSLIRQELNDGASIISLCRKYGVSRSTFRKFMMESGISRPARRSTA